jgi:TorA maturation chaperone TorD
MHSAAAMQAMAPDRQEDAADATDDRVRAHTYSLLGAVLAASPGTDLLALLAGVDPAPQASGDFAAAWRQLAIAAARADAGEVAQEYQDLFIGVGRGEVIPYGSWYMTGFLLDRPLALLRADLTALGFERQPQVKEPEDHAAALCETMAILIAEERALDAQRRFFHAHMSPWMGTFFRDLGDARAAAFYRAVAQFGGQFIAFEDGYLTMLA